MEAPKIKIKVDNFRAIKSADINLEGITVVTGENGCGKSTLSRLLYHVFRTSNNFDELVRQSLNRDLREITRFLVQVNNELFIRREKENLRYQFSQLSKNDLNEYEAKILATIDSVFKDIEVYLSEEDTKKYKSYSVRSSMKYKSDDIKITKLNRINRILADVLEISNINKINETIDINIKTSTGTLNYLLEQLKNRVIKNFRDAREKIIERPLAVLDNELLKVFSEKRTPNFKVEEFGVQINDKKEKRLLEVHSVQDIVYIDTPMIIGFDLSEGFSHWEDLNKKLEEKKSLRRTYNIKSIFNEDVLKGDISYSEEELNNIFIYERADGAKFNLIECATGLKSFAILLMLLKNGYLNKNTLVIIDEPEVHLHPQWVVEYARLLVLLYKKLGVQFFIASHHPDMISSIRYISEKEKVLDKVNFYLAKKENSDSFSYNFRHLGTEIDEIFTSFNIALERISSYGPT